MESALYQCMLTGGIGQSLDPAYASSECINVIRFYKSAYQSFRLSHESVKFTNTQLAYHFAIAIHNHCKNGMIFRGNYFLIPGYDKDDNLFTKLTCGVWNIIVCTKVEESRKKFFSVLTSKKFCMNNAISIVTKPGNPQIIDIVQTKDLGGIDSKLLQEANTFFLKAGYSPFPDRSVGAGSPPTENAVTIYKGDPPIDLPKTHAVIVIQNKTFSVFDEPVVNGVLYQGLGISPMGKLTFQINSTQGQTSSTLEFRGCTGASLTHGKTYEIVDTVEGAFNIFSIRTEGEKPQVLDKMAVLEDVQVINKTGMDLEVESWGGGALSKPTPYNLIIAANYSGPCRLVQLSFAGSPIALKNNGTHDISRNKLNVFSLTQDGKVQVEQQ